MLFPIEKQVASSKVNILTLALNQSVCLPASVWTWALTGYISIFLLYFMFRGRQVDELLKQAVKAGV